MHPLLLKLRPSAQLVCRMLVTVICATVAVLHPITRYTGAYTYLIMITKDVVFPPSTNPSAQVEAFVVNLTGVLIGLGWSNLGLVCCTYAARRYGIDSAQARSLKACFLVILAFVSGYVRSALPRLAFASKGACFIGIWLLSRNPITLEWSSENFTQLLFVCAISGSAGLLVALIMRLFTHPGGYAKDTIDALGLLNDLLRLSTTQSFEPEPEPTPDALCITSSDATAIKTPPAPSAQLEALQKSCLNASLALHTSYGYSAFELRIGRVPVRDIKPLLTTVNRVREELAWGHGHKRVSPTATPLRKRGPGDDSESALDGLDVPCRACANAIGDGISVLRAVVGKCYGVKVPPVVVSAELESSTTLVQGRTPSRERSEVFREPLVFREKIIVAKAELKARLDSLVHETNRERTLHRSSALGEDVSEPQDWGHDELFQKSLKATSLLHISSELIRALTLAHAILTIHRTSRPRLFLPRPSWFWLGMSPRALVAEEDPTIPANAPTSAPPPEADVLSINEARAVLPDPSIHGVIRNTSPNTSASVLPVPSTTRARKFQRWRTWITGWSPRVWMRTPRALRWRIRASAMLWSARHSKHVQHGIKNAFGVAMLLIPAVLPLNSPGKKYFSDTFGVWAIISFLYVLEPNTGMTYRIGIWRLFGTAIGTLYAYIAWLIVGVNPYGIVIFVTAAEVMLTWLIRTSTPGVGLVASVTIPPIMYIPYLGLERTSIIVLSLIRGMQIAIGIVAAIIINHMLFPRHCRVLFLSGMAQVLEELTALYLHLCHRTYNDQVRVKQGVAHAAKLELRIRELIARENLLLKEMEHEFSLMPKPTGLYRAGAETAQRIADLLSGLRRIRENVPQEAIEQVLEHRQHSVSCICIVLFACEHAFRSRRALPQMLPSPRKALDALSRELMERLQDGPRTDMGYAVAENEVLEEMVEALEMLIEIARTLFGTSSWLDREDEISGSFGRSGGATPGS